MTDRKSSFTWENVLVVILTSIELLRSNLGPNPKTNKMHIGSFLFVLSSVTSLFFLNPISSAIKYSGEFRAVPVVSSPTFCPHDLGQNTEPQIVPFRCAWMCVSAFKRWIVTMTFFLFIIVTFYEQKDWLFTSIQITLHGCLRVRKTRITVLQLCASTSQSSCSFYSKELDVCDGCSLFSWFIWDLALVRMGYARGHRGFDRTRWIHSFLTQSECLRQNVKKFLRGVSLILLVQQ